MNESLDETHENGVLNETTDTVHKRKEGEPGFQTDCGVSRHLTRDQLRSVAVERAIDGSETSKCGRCFPDGGGY